MARPTKQGLDYFNLDVDFLDDPKFITLISDHGSKGVHVLVQLLSWIYREGYALQWNDRLAKKLSAKTKVEIEEVQKIVELLLEEEFFSSVDFKKGWLSSDSIRKRFLQVGKRRTDFELPEVSAGFCGVSAELIGVSAEFCGVSAQGENNSAEFSAQKPRKEKKRKEKESKEKEIKENNTETKINSHSQPEKEKLTRSQIQEIIKTSPIGQERILDEYEEAAEQWLETPVDQDWTRKNPWMLSGRRPMVRFPLINISHPELADVFRDYDRAQVPRDRFSDACRAISGRLQTKLQAGENLEKISAFNWFISFIKKELLENLREERALENQEIRNAERLRA